MTYWQTDRQKLTEHNKKQWPGTEQRKSWMIYIEGGISKWAAGEEISDENQVWHRSCKNNGREPKNRINQNKTGKDGTRRSKTPKLMNHDINPSINCKMKSYCFIISKAKSQVKSVNRTMIVKAKLRSQQNTGEGWNLVHLLINSTTVSTTTWPL